MEKGAQVPTAREQILQVAEGRRLYIGNLAYATTEGELKDFFKDYHFEIQVYKCKEPLCKDHPGFPSHPDLVEHINRVHIIPYITACFWQKCILDLERDVNLGIANRLCHGAEHTKEGPKIYGLRNIDIRHAQVFPVEHSGQGTTPNSFYLGSWLDWLLSRHSFHSSYDRIALRSSIDCKMLTADPSRKQQENQGTLLQPPWARNIKLFLDISGSKTGFSGSGGRQKTGKGRYNPFLLAMFPLAIMAQNPGRGVTIATYASGTIAGGAGLALVQIPHDAAFAIPQQVFLYSGSTLSVALFVSLLCHGWVQSRERIPFMFWSFVLTALLCSLVSRDASPAVESWLQYLPLLVALSAFMSYLLLVVLRRQAETMARPQSPLASTLTPRSASLNDLEAQRGSILSSVNPDELPAARITSPARIDRNPNSTPVLRLHELSAYAEHR